MKQKLLAIAVFAMVTSITYSQNIGIGTNSPSSSAILDIASTSKGVLFPRMDSMQRKAIVNPSQGLMVIQKDLFYVYSGNTWGYVAPNKNQLLSISSGGSLWDCSQGLNATLTLTDDISLKIDNMIQGMIGIITVKQDATGNRRLILPTGSKVSGGGNGSLSLSSEPGSVDIISFYYDGENFYWNLKSNFN